MLDEVIQFIDYLGPSIAWIVIFGSHLPYMWFALVLANLQALHYCSEWDYIIRI